VDQPHAYAPEAGLSNYFELNTTHSATVKTYDWDLELPIMDTAPISQTAKETLDATIMTMAEWNAANQPVGDIWVLDTDGWAYWASPLEAGKATGLLMNEMKYTHPVVGTMYYAVYADADLATLSQLPMAWDGTASNAPMTREAETLVKVITDKPVRSLMQEVGLSVGPAETDLFLTFPTLQRSQIESLQVIDKNISDLAAFAAGTFNGRAIIDAIDLTHADSDLPVVAFYTEGNTAGRFDVYIAGRGGATATGSLMLFCARMIHATSIDLALLDTSRVTNMHGTFAHTYAPTSLGGLSNWDTSSVTDMSHMFANASALTSLDLSGWDTSNVTSMRSMFSSTTSLTNLDASNWDTSSVTNMSHMFANASALTSLDVSDWDTSNVTDMGFMFLNTNALTSLDLRNADFSNVTSNTDMFTNSGINTITVGSDAARDFIQSAPGWTRTPPRTIVIAN